MLLTRLRWLLCVGTGIVHTIATLPFRLCRTLGLGAQITRVLSKAHQLRNLAEYEGHFDVDSEFLAELMAAVEQLLSGAVQLGPVPGAG